MRRNRHPMDPRLRTLLDFWMLIAGCLITAAGVNLFLVPNRIATGGVVGVSILIQAGTGIEPALIQWIINIPLFLVGLKFLGGRYGVKTAMGSFLLPLFIFLTKWLSAMPVTSNALLASVYGGLTIGIGLGIIFRGRASTGGFSILAQIGAKYLGMAVGTLLMVIDVLIIASAAFVFGLEQALYALIVVFITGKVINAVQIGFDSSRVAFVISEKHEALTFVIMNDLDRGMTRLLAEGGYTGKERPVLMVVMDASEVPAFKARVGEVDPHAFIIISESHEVLGHGFTHHMMP